MKVIIFNFFRDCEEWSLIELQGDLESRENAPLSGKMIGDLHFSNKVMCIQILNKPFIICLPKLKFVWKTAFSITWGAFYCSFDKS